MSYWMNFDTDSSAFYIDQVTALFYALAILFAGLGIWKMLVVLEEHKEIKTDENVAQDLEIAGDSVMQEE